MTAKLSDRKRLKNARLFRRDADRLSTERVANRKYETKDLGAAFTPRVGMSERGGGVTLPPLPNPLPVGVRVVSSSAYAVALSKNGIYLGMFAVGDWGLKC